MTERPFTTSESERLGALARYRLPDGGEQEDFCDAAKLAAFLCGMPIAYVAFLDSNRQRIVGSVGLTTLELPRDTAFITPPEPGSSCWEIENTASAPYANSPLVTGEPRLGFYAAAALSTADGHLIGLLCVGDRTPGKLTSQQREGLETIARQIMRHLDVEWATDASFEALSDQTEALRERGDHFQLLNAIGEATRELSRPEAIMETSARLLGEHLGASRCAYAEVQSDHDTFSILHDYTDGCASTVGTYSLEVFGPRATAEMRNNRVLVVRDVDTELQDDPGVAMFNTIGIKAIICCPLVKADGLRAMMAVHQCTPRNWTENEIFLVQETVERCWATIERARAESTVTQTQKQFHDLFEFAPDAIIMANSEGSIVLLNQQAERLFGYERAELLQQPIEILLPMESRSAHVGLRKAFYRDAVPRTMGGGRSNLKGLKKDGTSFPVDISLSPLKINGNTWVAAAVRDVTEREQTQEHTLRAQRLESIGTLAGGVAHDLNNALAPILMATEVLREERPDDLELIESIESGAKRGAAMVRQLLTFAKGVEGERMVIKPYRLLQEMERIIKGTFPKSIRLQPQFTSDLQPIMGDSTQLHQVLLNLCVNARDAMPNGGVLTLYAENVNVDEAYASSIPDASIGPHVMIRVTDTGTGIEPEVMERIFEPFYSTKGPDRGTGLGLSTVLGIVKSHGGFMEAYSRPDRGASFSVFLQSARGESEEAHAEEPTISGYRGNGELILIVDDEFSVRDTASRLLRAMNFDVIDAEDGTQALIRAAENRDRIRVVLTDIHMPHVDGITLSQALRQMLPEVGIVVMSGRLEDREASELRRIGIRGILNKPFTRTKLVEALQAALET